MSSDQDTKPEKDNEIRVGSRTEPDKAGVHMFELMRDGGRDDLYILCIGPMALQQAFHSVVCLNSKLSSRGEQVTIHPVYEMIEGRTGEERTSNRLQLVRRRVKLDVE